MKFKTKYKILLLKRYFDTGYGITNYFKYPLIFFGAYSFQTNIDLMITLLISIIWGVFCFIFGWAFIKYDWYKIDLEITNKLNIFVEEMRKFTKRQRFK